MMTPGGMLPAWTEADERRHQWLLHHIRTCTACELLNQDNSSSFCADLDAHLSKSDPEARAGQPAAGGG